MNPIHPEAIIAEVEHNSLVPFLKPHLKLNRRWGLIYWLLNAVSLGYTIYFILANAISFDRSVNALGLGFALFFLILPVHECIHALMYKMFGAAKVGFGADWKKLVFYATADQFVIGEKKFRWVALSPFLLISVTLIILMIPFPAFRLVALGALILHTGGCFGDFALVSFMHIHRDRGILTMDNVSEGKTYFFERAAPSHSSC